MGIREGRVVSHRAPKSIPRPSVLVAQLLTDKYNGDEDKLVEDVMTYLEGSLR